MAERVHALSPAQSMMRSVVLKDRFQQAGIDCEETRYPPPGRAVQNVEILFRLKSFPSGSGAGVHGKRCCTPGDRLFGTSYSVDSGEKPLIR